MTDDDTQPRAGDTPGLEVEPALPRPLKRRRRELPFVDDLRAVALGIRETARDILKAGREEARRAQDEAWSHYDDLTKHRRER